MAALTCGLKGLPLGLKPLQSPVAARRAVRIAPRAIAAPMEAPAAPQQKQVFTVSQGMTGSRPLPEPSRSRSGQLGQRAGAACGAAVPGPGPWVLWGRAAAPPCPLP